MHRAEAGAPSPAIKPLPKAPTLDWDSFKGPMEPTVSAVDDAPVQALTTSGRAAIHHALQQLRLPPGARVLVPTYHCPTMVAPIVRGGFRPAFFCLGPDGLPALERIPERDAQGAGAMIVPHYFGLPLALGDVRAWCDARGIALIEDCAHSFFGQAGERPVGAWGDFAAASLSKFFPVSEAGLLASWQRPTLDLDLQPAGWKAQVKGVVDVLEVATRYRRLKGVRTLVQGLLSLRRPRAVVASAPANEAATDFEQMYQSCDMARIDQQVLSTSRALHHWLPRRRIVDTRRSHYAHYTELLQAVPGAHPIHADLPTQCAPYVFPLWADEPDDLYQAMRARGLPVFRWDRLWPGTPQTASDTGASWSRHVLQLLCHQDLSHDDIAHVAGTTVHLLRHGGR